MIFRFLFLISLFFAIAWTSDITLNAGPVACEYKKKDLVEKYNPNTSVIIDCTGSYCTLNSNVALVSVGFVNITSAGTYVLRGVLEGQVVINATEDEHVQLVLEDASIFSKSGPAIYGISADKITLTIVGNNTLSDTFNYNVGENEPDACLFSESDLSINGSGSLTIISRFGDAIGCKEDLKLIDTRIIVPSSSKKGIKARNSLCVKDANIFINSMGTGIKVSKDNKVNKGYIVIDGNSSIAIASNKDGISAQSHLTINRGYIDIKQSKEGLEAQMIDILGGEIHIIAANDGINASRMGKNSTDYSSLDDDSDIYVNIIGGKTFINIHGNDCDGIDSNGAIYIGGEAEVYSSIHDGSIFSLEAAFEAKSLSSIVNGATVIATATKDDYNINNGIENVNINGLEGNINGLSGNINVLNENIYQPYLYTIVPIQIAGTRIIVKDSENNIIVSSTPEVSYQNILVTSPKLIYGQVYTIVVGDTIVQTVSASEGNNGSIDSPSISSLSQRKPSTFEEYVILDREYDIMENVEVNDPNKDEVVFKDYVENDLLKLIEEEIDDYIDKYKPITSITETNKATKENETNIPEDVQIAETNINANTDIKSDNNQTVPPKYFHFNISNPGNYTRKFK